MYALINNNSIEETRRALPATWEHDGQLWDIRPGQHNPADAGWHEVIDTPRPADTGTHTHESSIELVDGVPTRVWTPRPWPDEEIASRAEAEARLTDLEARITNIEAKLWPAPAEDTPADDAPTWAELERPGWWMPSTLLSDGGRIWRNVSGTVLTTPPSGFPGGTGHWKHLFVEHSSGHADPEPEEPEEPGVPDYVQPTGAHDAYNTGDQVRFEGQVWESLIDGNAWTPAAYPQGWKLIS